MTNPTITDRDLREFLARQLAASRRSFHRPQTPFTAGYMAAERATVSAFQHARDIKRARRAARR